VRALMRVGIGYFTLPVLASAGAAMVHACEWNPNAIEALRRGLEANKVSSRCDVRPGDCRQVGLCVCVCVCVCVCD
jgi:tRNA wybutosine-synthesizing protein 2